MKDAFHSAPIAFIVKPIDEKELLLLVMVLYNAFYVLSVDGADQEKAAGKYHGQIKTDWDGEIFMLNAILYECK